MSTRIERPDPYIFLSYASVDRERALRVTDLLEARGISVWIDRKSIAGGTSWTGEIVEGIKGCVSRRRCSPGRSSTSWPAVSGSKSRTVPTKHG